MNEERAAGSDRSGEAGHSIQSPYGPNTSRVRSFLVELNGLTARDWIVFTHDYQRRQKQDDVVRADTALAAAVGKGALEDARDAVVGPVVQLAGRIANESGGAAHAAGLEVDDLAEAALAGALALVAEPLMSDRDVHALMGHLEPMLASVR